MTVCHGNICRSPMAEVVLRARIAEAGLGDVDVVSTGVSDEEHGNPIDRRAVAVLRDHGYEVPQRAARRVTRGDLEAADLTLAMTSRHARQLARLGIDAEVRLYRSFDPAAEPHDLDIDDPWYGGRADFEAVLAQLEAGADGVVAWVRQARQMRSR